MKVPSSPAILVFIALAGLPLIAPDSKAQVPKPAQPERYRAQLRYLIDASPLNRIPQFDEFLRDLKAAGFKKDPVENFEQEEADRRFTRMWGSIAAADVPKLLSVHRVRAALLYPEKYTAPDSPEQPVNVELGLRPGLGLRLQRRMADQLRPFLERTGFQEAIGYDHRGHTRIVGAIPAGLLEVLLNDLRQNPLEQEEPIRSSWPIRMVEVIPDQPGIDPISPFIPDPPPPQEDAHLLKISRDLAILLGEHPQDQRIRLEVILDAAPRDFDRSWENLLLRAAPAGVIEHRLGPVVVLRALPGSVAELAKLTIVTTVRLPRSASPPVQPKQPESDIDLNTLQTLAADHLRQIRGRGKGIRVVVVAEDFRNYQQFLSKVLPPSTRLLDLTAERSPGLEPESIEGSPQAVGTGTYQALAVAVAAPECELTLVRIGVAAPYQLDTVARAIAGESLPSGNLHRRSAELHERGEELSRQRDKLSEERRSVLADFSQDEAAVKRRQAFFKREAELEAEEAAYQRRVRRYLDLFQGLRSLRGTHVVSCSLVWNDGYPVDGGGILTRHLDDHLGYSALWLQAAGDTQGQAWAGPFYDEDGNGVMEFAPSGTPLRPERWSAELNFLAWQPHAAPRVLDLPAKAIVRLSLQWREAHEPEFLLRGEDLYRSPLSNLGLLVLRQRDPSGKKLAIDAMEVVARSHDLAHRLPQRLDNQPGWAIYEQVLEFTVEKAGRYAVRVEGRPNLSTWPPGVPTIPAVERQWELRPRLFAQVLDAPSQLSGRPVWLDYWSGEGSLGMPADARSVLTVGTADSRGDPQAYSPTGPAHNLRLLPKPDMLLPIQLSPGGERTGGTGTALGAGFAAGVAASALSSGVPCDVIRQKWSRRHAIPPREESNAPRTSR